LGSLIVFGLKLAHLGSLGVAVLLGRYGARVLWCLIDVVLILKSLHKLCPIVVT